MAGRLRSAVLACLLASSGACGPVAADETRWATFDVGDVELEGHVLRGVTVALGPGAKRARVTVTDAGLSTAFGRIRGVRLSCDPVTIQPAAVDCIGGRFVFSVDGRDVVVDGRVRLRRRATGFELRADALRTPAGRLALQAIPTRRGWRVTARAPRLALAGLGVPGLAGQAVLDARVKVEDGAVSGTVEGRVEQLDLQAGHPGALALAGADGELRATLDGTPAALAISLDAALRAGRARLGAFPLARSTWPLDVRVRVVRSGEHLSVDAAEARGADGLAVDAVGEAQPGAGIGWLRGTATLPRGTGRIDVSRWSIVHHRRTVFEADATLVRWPLGDIASALGFATITGRVDGVLTGLRLVDGHPERFDVQLLSATPRAPGEYRHVSGAFLDTMSNALGTPRPLSSIEAEPGGVRPGDWQAYGRVALACRYRGGACEADASPDSRYLLVEAGDDPMTPGAVDTLPREAGAGTRP